MKAWCKTFNTITHDFTHTQIWNNTPQDGIWGRTKGGVWDFNITMMSGMLLNYVHCNTIWGRGGVFPLNDTDLITDESMGVVLDCKYPPRLF